MSGARGWPRQPREKTRMDWDVMGEPSPTCARVRKGPDPSDPVTLYERTVSACPFGPVEGGEGSAPATHASSWPPAPKARLVTSSVSHARATNESAAIAGDRRRPPAARPRPGLPDQWRRTPCVSLPPAPRRYRPSYDPHGREGPAPRRRLGHTGHDPQSSRHRRRRAPREWASCAQLAPPVSRAGGHQASTWGRRLPCRCRHPGVVPAATSAAEMRSRVAAGSITSSISPKLATLSPLALA